MNLDPALVGLAGTLLGWGLSELSAHLRRRGERREKLQEQRLSNYAEWLTGMKAHFVAYALQSARADATKYDVALCEQRLHLIEADEKARRLMQAVWNGIPEMGTDAQLELARVARGAPTIAWPPFERATDELVRHIRDTTSR